VFLAMIILCATDLQATLFGTGLRANSRCDLSARDSFSPSPINHPDLESVAPKVAKISEFPKKSRLLPSLLTIPTVGICFEFVSLPLITQWLDVRCELLENPHRPPAI